MVDIVDIERSHHARNTQSTCVRPLAAVPTRYDSINVIRVYLGGVAQVRLLRPAVLRRFVIILEVVHPSLLLSLCSFTLKVNYGLQSFV